MTWTVMDAAFAAALAAGLWVLSRPVAARLGRSAAGPCVAAVLVLAFAGTVFTRGEPVARVVAAGIVIASATAVARRRHRRGSGAPRNHWEDRNAIAPPFRR